MNVSCLQLHFFWREGGAGGGVLLMVPIANPKTTSSISSVQAYLQLEYCQKKSKLM